MRAGEKPIAEEIGDAVGAVEGIGSGNRVRLRSCFAAGENLFFAMAIDAGPAEQAEDADPQLAAESGFDLPEGLAAFGIFTICAEEDEIVVEPAVFKGPMLLNSRVDEVGDEGGAAAFLCEGLEFSPAVVAKKASSRWSRS